MVENVIDVPNSMKKNSDKRRNVECRQQTGVVNQKQLPSGGEPRLASRLVRALGVTVPTVTKVCGPLLRHREAKTPILLLLF